MTDLTDTRVQDPVWPGDPKGRALASEEVSFDDLPDFTAPTLENADELPAICQQDGCSNPVAEYSGRGPRPKFCPEHKPTRTPAATGSGRGRGWAKAAEVEAQLNTYVYMIAGGLQFTILAPDGRAIQHTGPALVHEIVELARTDKNLRDVLERLALPGKYAPITIAATALLVSVAANHLPIVSLIVPFVPGAYVEPTPANQHSAGGEPQ